MFHVVTSFRQSHTVIRVNRECMKGMGRGGGGGSCRGISIGIRIVDVVVGWYGYCYYRGSVLSEFVSGSATATATLPFCVLCGQKVKYTVAWIWPMVTRNMSTDWNIMRLTRKPTQWASVYLVCWEQVPIAQAASSRIFVRWGTNMFIHRNRFFPIGDIFGIVLPSVDLCPH